MQHCVQPSLQTSHSPLRRAVSARAASMICTSFWSPGGGGTGIRKMIALTPRETERCLHRIVGDGVHQADPEGLPSVYLLRRQEHLQCAAFTDQARQTLRAAPSGDQAQGGAAVPKESMRTGDAALAGQREVKPSSHAVTVYRRNGRSWKACHRSHQSLTQVREAKCLGSSERGDFVEISSSGKEMCVARNDQT